MDSHNGGKSKKKKGLAGKLVLLLAVCLVYWSYVRPKPSDFPKSKYYDPIVSDYSYRALPGEVTRDLYDKIAENAYVTPTRIVDRDWNLLENIPNKDGATETEFYLAIDAYQSDHPEVFWLGWATPLESNEEDPFKPDHFVLLSMYPLEELKELLNEQKEALKQFIDSVPSGLDEQELQKYVHDWLIDNCEYDYDALTEDGDLDPDYINYSRVCNAIGPLSDGMAVCSGYAHAYQLLLNRLGVDCVRISGQGKPINEDLQMRTGPTHHEWNAVKNNGDWVMTDPTWDDSEDAARRYDYYNIPISQMYETHNAQTINFDSFVYSPYFQLNAYGDNIFLPD